MPNFLKSVALVVPLLALGTLMPRAWGSPQFSRSPSGQHAQPSSGSSQQGGVDAITAKLDSFGYEHVGGGKYALVVSGYNTWVGAYQTCKAQIPGASLFLVSSAADSTWLGNRINYQKDRVNGASKFWVGLISRAANGPLQWLDGTTYTNFQEVVQVSGHDDGTKHFAWAVPDSFSRLKYEFLTVDDEAEAYICQNSSLESFVGIIGILESLDEFPLFSFHF